MRGTDDPITFSMRRPRLFRMRFTLVLKGEREMDCIDDGNRSHVNISDKQKRSGKVIFLL